MKHQSLSISASERTKYFATLVLSAAVVVALSAGTIFLARVLGRDALPNQTLLEYQIRKVSERSGDDTVFVGDSSLGNAINAEVWSELSSSRAVNLALSGSFGYEGSYNMMRRVLAERAPRHVIIMQQAGMMQRPPSDLGNLVTAPGLYSTLVAYWKLGMSVQQVQESISWLLTYGGAALAGGPLPMRSRESQIVDDYVRQAPPRHSNPNPEPLSVASINREKIEYLRKIAELCAAYDIDCIYVHGPFTEPNCSQSRAYFEEVARLIAGAGLRLARVMPICAPEDDIGDGEDHIHPSLKAKYTRKYFEVLASQLRR